MTFNKSDQCIEVRKLTSAPKHLKHCKHQCLIKHFEAFIRKNEILKYIVGSELTCVPCGGVEALLIPPSIQVKALWQLGKSKYSTKTTLLFATFPKSQVN